VFGLCDLRKSGAHLDAAQCTMVSSPGDAVRLRVGPARWGGGLKALHVEEPEVATVAPAPPPGERAWPWDDRDVRMLRGIAAHAAALAAADDYFFASTR
jgi:hypothetical protein